jgi:hypothetical protein
MHHALELELARARARAELARLDPASEQALALLRSFP